jgi:hypothetical protein
MLLLLRPATLPAPQAEWGSSLSSMPVAKPGGLPCLQIGAVSARSAPGDAAAAPVVSLKADVAAVVKAGARCLADKSHKTRCAFEGSRQQQSSMPTPFSPLSCCAV